MIRKHKIRLLPLILLLLFSFSCAKDLTSREKHRLAADKLMENYTAAHHAFKQLEQSLPSSAQDDLDNFRKPMNDLKRGIIHYVEVVLADNLENADKRKQKLTEKAQDIFTDLTVLGIEYGVEVKEPNDE